MQLQPGPRPATSKMEFPSTHSADSSNPIIRRNAKPAFGLAFFSPVQIAATQAATRIYRLDHLALSLLAAGAMCLVPFIQPRHSSPIGTFYDEWLAFAFGLTAITIVCLQVTKERPR